MAPSDPSAGLREELEAIVARVVELMDPQDLGIQLRLVADAPRHPKLFAAFQEKVMGGASSQLTSLLRLAVSEGELPEDVDIHWAADALIGVVFMRTVRAWVRARSALPPTPNRHLDADDAGYESEDE